VRIAFRSASERCGQAWAKRVKAGSGVAGVAGVPVTLDRTLPNSGKWLFSEENGPGSIPAASILRRSSINRRAMQNALRSLGVGGLFYFSRPKGAKYDAIRLFVKKHIASRQAILGNN